MTNDSISASKAVSPTSLDFQGMIDRLDTAIFACETQTSTGDRQSLLRLQRLVRHQNEPYTYLEIGSHLGGSLLPHLADPRCDWAISIDPRPMSQPDERGRLYSYRQNSRDRMLEGLRSNLPAECLEKLQIFDLDAAALPHAEVSHRVRLALIDGEHTNIAAFSDFLSIFPLLAEDTVVVYHDANLIADSIQNAERFLRYLGIPHETVFLPDHVAAIGLRGMAAQLVEAVAEVAHQRETYLVLARRNVHSAVAAEIIASGEVDGSIVAPRLSEEIGSLRARLHGIEANPLYRASHPLRAILSRLQGR